MRRGAHYRGQVWSSSWLASFEVRFRPGSMMGWELWVMSGGCRPWAVYLTGWSTGSVVHMALGEGKGSCGRGPGGLACSECL